MQKYARGNRASQGLANERRKEAALAGGPLSLFVRPSRAALSLSVAGPASLRPPTQFEVSKNQKSTSDVLPAPLPSYSADRPPPPPIALDLQPLVAFLVVIHNIVNRALRIRKFGMPECARGK